jgi:hypothetical protein
VLFRRDNYDLCTSNCHGLSANPLPRISASSLVRQLVEGTPENQPAASKYRAALAGRLCAVDHKHSVGMSSAFMSLRFSSLRHSASSLSTLSDIMGKKISSAGHYPKKICPGPVQTTTLALIN